MSEELTVRRDPPLLDQILATANDREVTHIEVGQLVWETIRANSIDASSVPTAKGTMELLTKEELTLYKSQMTVPGFNPLNGVRVVLNKNMGTGEARKVFNDGFQVMKWQSLRAREPGSMSLLGGIGV